MGTRKFINHWGVWVDPAIPVTGVISLNAVSQFVSDEICGADSIDLGYVEAKNEFITEFQRQHHFRKPTDQELEEFNDEFESSPSDYLIGSWKQDRFGKYEHDTSKGDYAAIVREDVVQVVWSKYVTKCKNLCSPCYPGQADVNSGKDEPDGVFLAYNLPPDAYQGEVEELPKDYAYCPKCEKAIPPKKIVGSVYYYQCPDDGYTFKTDQDKPEFPFGEFDDGKHWQGDPYECDS